MWNVLHYGFDLTDFALFLNRFLLGAFFVLARFRFFYDPSKTKGFWTADHFTLKWVPNQRWLNKDRFASLEHKMQYCGLKKYSAFWAWAVAVIEVGGGLLLILGYLTAFAGFGLLVLTVRATMCTAKMKVFEQNPVDKIDICACYLWRVEGLYIAMALVAVVAGPGAFALSNVLL